MPKRNREQARNSPLERMSGRRSPELAPSPDPRRDRILAAAELLFAERGYERVTVREVAESAGVTHPLIYYYWESKRGLLAAVLERNQQRVRSLVKGQTDPRETVLAIIRNYLDEGRLYLLIMARSFLGGMPVQDWPGGYPGMESAIDALLAAGPEDDPQWDEERSGGRLPDHRDALRLGPDGRADHGSGRGRAGAAPAVVRAPARIHRRRPEADSGEGGERRHVSVYHAVRRSSPLLRS